MADVATIDQLKARFRSLERLRWSGRRRRTPFVQQLQVSDCAAACLAMVLGHHGRRVPLRETQAVLDVGDRGVSAEQIIEGARRFGLIGRGVRIDVDQLEALPPATILHWGFDHFVVFERMTRRGALIIDPSSGRRRVPLDRLAQELTGIALLFEPGATFAEGDAGRPVLRRYLRQLLQHRRALIWIGALTLTTQVLALGTPLLTGQIVDRAIPRGDVGLLLGVGGAMLALLATRTVTGMLRAQLLLQLRTLLDVRLSLGFLHHLARLPYSFFTKRPPGDLIGRFESNQTLRETLTSSTLSSVLDGLLVSLHIVVLLALSQRMALLVVVVGALHVAVFLFVRKYYRELQARDLEVQARSRSQLVEMLSGMEALKANGAEHRFVERWSHVLVDELNVSLERGRLYMGVGAVRETLAASAPLLVLIVGAWEVLQGHFTLGTMLAIAALANGFLAPLSNLVSTALALSELRSDVERVDDVFSETPEQESSTDRALASSAPLRGEIRIEDLSFSYEGTRKTALAGIDVAISPGQKIALCGRSGSGKSTLARVLVGLEAPTRGKVLYDGRDLANLDLDTLRRKIGVVTQDSPLFNMTIRDNITFGDPDLDLAAVQRAARQAAIHDDIMALPMGYDTPLAARGATLSGGQRQRIALARALVRQPAVLVLDEATSDLDTITERRVMDALAQVRSTRVVVAHRLSTIRDADVILVLENGSIVESGCHDELAGRNGAYARLIAAQEAGESDEHAA